MIHLVSCGSASLELFVFLIASLTLVFRILFGVRRSPIAGDASETGSVCLRKPDIHACSVMSHQIAICLDRFASVGTYSVVGLILLVMASELAVWATKSSLGCVVASLAILSRRPLKWIWCCRRSFGLVCVIHSVHKGGQRRVNAVEEVWMRILQFTKSMSFLSNTKGLLLFVKLF